MLNKVIDLNQLKLTGKSTNLATNDRDLSRKDIAIIGMSARFSSANNADEYWKGLCEGKDFIVEFPDNRKKDNEQFVDFWNKSGILNIQQGYSKGGFFSEIDKFDYSFFNMSPREAELMDPNQRIFLQTMWEAIEEAGYGGKKLCGTNTGVFVGYSSDSGEEYKRYLQVTVPSIYQPMEPGNVKSIIGSRISYLLDLKGSSIMVDTACSSSLVAIHLAVQSLKNGECSTALAGGIKINLLPFIKINNEDGLGIESSDGRTKTFDDSSDGTGIGEGAGVLVLKPLDQAISDGDHIHAIIKGSAVNQDGASVGITAPNTEAQQDVIIRAWKESKIDPETVSYIECHGTGTKLGDPVEINGIERAFRKFTQKKQFCGVGSVKTNMGHIDNAAGIASIIKVILALKNKKLPPSINFKKPNRKIAFVDSPVYINDQLQEWKVEGFRRRCGVSSFGLSGTNCHILLEEYIGSGHSQDSVNVEGNIFTLSAKDKDTLARLVGMYYETLLTNPEYSLGDICFTANTGRGHYNCRVAVIANDLPYLLEKLNKLHTHGLLNLREEGIYFGEHRVVPAKKKEKSTGELTEDEKKQNSTYAATVIRNLTDHEKDRRKEHLLNEICELYINGADINWEDIYKGCKNRRLSLPSYPFSRTRCWIRPEAVNYSQIPLKDEKNLHPLMEKCIVESNGIRIYSTKFSAEKHWVLNEHKVVGSYVIPGTTYLEAARYIGTTVFRTESIELNDVMFLAPFSLSEGEEKELHGIFKQGMGIIEFSFSSKSRDDMWVTHAEGKITVNQSINKKTYSIDKIKEKLIKQEFVDYSKIVDWGVEVGNRFKNIRVINSDENEALAYLELSEEYRNDLEELYLHPALLDSAVNMANSTAGSGLYLPLSYKNLMIFGALPTKIYCYIRKNNKGKASKEVSTFHISILDLNGNLLVETEDYTVKKVHENEIAAIKEMGSQQSFYEIAWTPEILKKTEFSASGKFAVLKDKTGFGDNLIHALKSEGIVVVEIEEGHVFEKVNEQKYFIDYTEESYNKLLKSLGTEKSLNLVHCSSIDNFEGDVLQRLERGMKKGVFSLFSLAKVLASIKINTQVHLFVISDYANEITGSEVEIKPHNASLIGLGKVIPQENGKIVLKCIDIDQNTDCENICAEIINGSGGSQVGYRNNVRYRPEFRRARLAEKYENEITILNKGVYLITGGLGGIGLEIARLISMKDKTVLCLVNRTELPERNKWDEILAKDDNPDLCKKIRAVIEIEKSGSQVLCYSVDVSDKERMNDLINMLRSRYGRINGVIHAAGIAGNGFIMNKDEQTFESVIRPKTVGTAILEQLTDQDSLDFFIMFSSVTSLMGIPGQSDYTAGNAYLDSFVSYIARKDKKALTINWPAWKETGMAYDYGVVQEDTIFKPLTTASALNSFELLLGTNLKRAIPVELNYNMFGGYSDDQPFIISQEIVNAINKHSRTDKRKNDDNSLRNKEINILGKSLEECRDTELKLAGIWGKVFAVDSIDIFASISELGGDSLAATKLLKEMEKEFAGLVDISDIFTYPTIFEMADYIEGKTMVKDSIEETTAEEDDIDKILKKLALGEITLGEAESLVKLGDIG